MLNWRPVRGGCSTSCPYCITMGLSVSSLATRQEVYFGCFLRLARVQQIPMPGMIMALIHLFSLCKLCLWCKASACLCQFVCTRLSAGECRMYGQIFVKCGKCKEMLLAPRSLDYWLVYPKCWGLCPFSNSVHPNLSYNFCISNIVVYFWQRMNQPSVVLSVVFLLAL